MTAINHLHNTKSVDLCSVCERLAGVNSSIKSTKNQFHSYYTAKCSIMVIRVDLFFMTYPSMYMYMYVIRMNFISVEFIENLTPENHSQIE